MQQGKADGFSWCSYMELRPGEPAFELQKQILLGPKQHAIEGHMDHRLYLKDQGAVRCPRFDQCRNRR